MTSNQINYFKAQEERRHNVATEELSEASNRINLLNANTNARQADTAALVANIRSRELLETQRSNMAREAETQRSNVAREYETYRANVAALNEQTRSNLANESLVAQRNYETTRSNQVSESLTRIQQTEQQRHNAVSEQLSSASTRANVLSGLIGTAGRLIGVALGR